MATVNPTPAPQSTGNILVDYIQQNTFRRLISGDRIVDTRPYVGIIRKAPKAPLEGLRFTGVGFAAVYGKPEAPTIENSGYLPVTHFEAGHEQPIPGKDWQAILSALPPGTTVFVDEYHDSNLNVASVTFLKRADGTWGRSGADRTH